MAGRVDSTGRKSVGNVDSVAAIDGHRVPFYGVFSAGRLIVIGCVLARPGGDKGRSMDV